MDQPSAPRPARKRTFTGCKTCRNRRVKCDDVHPECGPCKQAKLTCGGYWSPLLWITEGVVTRPKEHNNHKGFEFRYPVLSEPQRQHMSTAISESLGRRSAPDLISRLDAACNRLESREEHIPGLFKGPFGAFSIQTPVHERISSATESTSPPIVAPQLEQLDGSDGSGPELEWTGVQANLENNDSTDFLQFLDSIGDIDQYVDESFDREGVIDGDLPESFFESLTTDNLLTIDGELPLYEPYNGAKDGQLINTKPTPSRSRRMSLSIIAPDLTPASEIVMPVHSEPLLRHYREQIFQSEISQAKPESPWQLIFFPCALETFAELSLWRNTSHTRFALLCGLLSLSAFHLYRTGDSDFRGETWQCVAAKYQLKAQAHLRTALKTEMSGAGQIKYKELLMAILAISMISLSRGDSSFQVFLLDAERFIRRQGLVDNIPLEYRVLHHMYSHLRILAESVGHRLEAPTDDPTRAYNEPPEKDGKFCLATECYDIGLDPTDVKTPDVGYTDIHLQVQGEWRKSLYPAIFGFPESLWTLLSQTVATSNEKTRLESLNQPDSLATNALNHHILNLERTIWAWTPTADLIGPQRPEHLSSPQTRDLLDNPESKPLAQGLHQALILYFYRKTHNLSPMILQDVVSKAIDYLEPCLPRIHDHDLGICIAWAALTAACEAVDPKMQQRALKILSATDEQGILLTNKPSQEVAASIWEHRKTPGGGNVSWQDYIASK